jgi:hypothetical protein
LHAQSISNQLSSSPTNVRGGGKAEALGDIRLTRIAGNGIQATQASSISFRYQDILIANTFSGPLTIPVSGVLSSPGGITVTVTGGYLGAGVQVQVANLSSANSVSGMLTLSIPAGLNIAAEILFRSRACGQMSRGWSTNRLFGRLCQPIWKFSFATTAATVALVVDLSLKLTVNSCLMSLSSDLTSAFSVSGGTPPHVRHYARVCPARDAI